MQVENSSAHLDSGARPAGSATQLAGASPQDATGGCMMISGTLHCEGFGFMASQGSIPSYNESIPCPACNTILWLANAKNQASAPMGAGSDMPTEQIWLEALRVAHRENPGGVHAALEAVGEVQVRVQAQEQTALVVRTYNSPSQFGEAVLDDAAVDAIALNMKVKMARNRAKGRSGWNDETTCTADFLSTELREHVAKGDPLDVAIYAMMLHLRGETISAPACSTHLPTENDPA
uniref:Uncharacterized protein n=5 Tax=Pseudomonas TaxID=286 RepID=A0A3G1HJN1_PSEAI|nr:Hypothetical protein [Pseudomonas aeruginosa]